MVLRSMRAVLGADDRFRNRGAGHGALEYAHGTNRRLVLVNGALCPCAPSYEPNHTDQTEPSLPLKVAGRALWQESSLASSLAQTTTCFLGTFQFGPRVLSKGTMLACVR
jgi:hypothetical protein